MRLVNIVLLSVGEWRTSQGAATDTAINAAQTDLGPAQSYVSMTGTAYDSDAMKTNHEGVSALVGGLPGLGRALHEVVKLHSSRQLKVCATRPICLR